MMMIIMVNRSHFYCTPGQWPGFLSRGVMGYRKGEILPRETHPLTRYMEKFRGCFNTAPVAACLRHVTTSWQTRTP